MNQPDKRETKEKVKEAARELFAQKTFEGTSVRDIAEAAQVNVSAINYHFKNKENLYYEIIRSCYQEMTEQITELYSKFEHSFSDFMEQVYLFFIDDSEYLASNFSLFINNHIDFDHFSEGDMLGPPGELMVRHALSHHYPKLDKDQQTWIIKVLYSFMIHSALISYSSLSNRKQVGDRWSRRQLLKDFRQLLTRIL